MTHQESLMGQVHIIQLLLEYLPTCETEAQKYRILEEVGRMRSEVSRIEEMTRTERQMDVRMMKVTIESEINYDQEREIDPVRLNGDD